MKNTILLTILCLIPLVTFAQSHSILKNIGEGDESAILTTYQSTNWNGLTYFITAAPFSRNRIWSTDGTEENTVEVFSNNYPAMTLLTSIDDCLLFNGWPDEHRALYRSDGSEESILKLAEFPGYSVEFLQKLNNHTALFITSDFFQDTTFLWSTDGTIDGTILLGEYGIKPDFLEITFYKNNMVFTERSTNPTTFAPVISDGTLEGTMLVTDYINAVTSVDEVEFAVGTEDFLFVNTVMGDKVFDGTGISNFNIFGDCIQGFKLGKLNIVFSGDEIMVYDSLAGSSYALATDVYYFSNPISNGSKVFFHDNDGYVFETDGTDIGTKKLSSVKVGALNYDPYLFYANNKLYYNSTQVSDYSLWEVDLDTQMDSIFSIYRPLGTSNIDPYMFTAGEHLVYGKSSTTYGKEYWVYTNLPTGLANLVDTYQINISPNPSQSEVTITFDFDLPRNSSISVFNSLGQLVLESANQAMQWRLNVSKLFPGQYFLQLNSSDGIWYLGSFVKG